MGNVHIKGRIAKRLPDTRQERDWNLRLPCLVDKQNDNFGVLLRITGQNVRKTALSGE